MSVPNSITDLSTTAALNSPSGSDNISTADDYLRAVQGIIKTVYDAQAVVNTTISGKADLAGATFTGVINEKQGADIASASTINLTTATGNYTHITGTTTITAITLAQGARRTVVFDGILMLTNGASLILPSGANITTAAGDTAVFIGEAAGVVRCIDYTRKDGTALVAVNTVSSKIQPISASVAASALTITLNPTTLDFRSATLGSGTVNTRTIASAISLVISSGSTLGAINGIQSRIAVLAIDVGGTIELAAVNIAGGNDLSETGLISTTAEGGAGAADSANIIYSTTARTSVPYRIVGYVESTQATAGTWATAPSTIQGYGGQAFSALSSFGFGQTWQSVTRTTGTTYYNTTGKLIALKIKMAASTTIAVTIGATTFNSTATAGTNDQYVYESIPPNTSYSITISAGSITTWELR